MEQALAGFMDMRAVFVDAPGFAGEQNLTKWREEMVLSDREAVTHLAISPFFDSLRAKAFLQRYKSDGSAGIVNVACAREGGAITELSFGVRLKESIVSATGALIWRLIFNRQLPGKTAQ
ncbi:MAG: hypothetical protein LBS77_05290 [Desulfovibrio sp.]|jgi:flagellar biosynthesis protein FlhF|nr:hypothetical protein [Desulfovibrio sp.]